MTRIINPGISLGAANTLTGDTYIYVGNTRQFNNIRDAISSIGFAKSIGNIYIVLDPGVYNHYPVYIDNQELSNRLYIVSADYFSTVEPISPSVFLNCIPDPTLGNSIPLGSYISIAAIPNGLDYIDSGTNTSNVSFGFITDSGFVLKIYGLAISGAIDSTICGIGALNGSQIESINFPIAGKKLLHINNTMVGAHASHESILQIDSVNISYISGLAISAFYSSTVYAKNSNINNISIFTPSLGLNTGYLQGYIGLTVFNSVICFNGSYFADSINGVMSTYNSTIQVSGNSPSMNTIFSNVPSMSQTNNAINCTPLSLTAVSNSSIEAINVFYTSCYAIAFADTGSSINSRNVVTTTTHKGINMTANFGVSPSQTLLASVELLGVIDFTGSPALITAIGANANTALNTVTLQNSIIIS